MCIGLPMQVVAVGPSWADVQGRNERRRVRTALVGEVGVGEWLLVHLDSAVQKLDAARAAEVDSALDLLQAALKAPPDSGLSALDLNFELPSARSVADFEFLTGQK